VTTLKSDVKPGISKKFITSDFIIIRFSFFSSLKYLLKNKKTILRENNPIRWFSCLVNYTTVLIAVMLDQKKCIQRFF